MPVQSFSSANVDKVIGTPGVQFWSTVQVFEVRGEIVSLVLTINPQIPTVDLKSQGEEIVGYAATRYKNDQSPVSPEKLQSLAKTTVSRFGDAGVKLQICVIKDRVGYFCTEGGGEVTLSRGGNEYKLISSASRALSGPVKVGDLFTISSGEGEHDSKALISPLFPAFQPDPVIESASSLSPKTYHLPQSGKLRLSPLVFFKKALQKFRKPSSPEATPKRTVLSVGVVLILLLVISVAFGAVQKSKKEYREKYEARLVEAEKSFEDALVQEPINSKAAKELFVKSRELTLVLKEEGIKDSRLTELEAKLNENSAKLLGIIDATPKVFLDLALVREGLAPYELVLDQDKMALLDQSGSRVVTVSTEGTGTTVLGGGEKVGGARSVAVYAGRVFVLSEKGVLELSSSGGVSTALEPDPEWGSPIKVGAFGSNLYLMTDGGEIWRFPSTNKGFAPKQKWLGPGVTISASPLDWAFDGSIWVLSAGSKIQKYTRGAPNSFSTKGLDVSFSEVGAIYTDETLNSLFVLDAKNGRVVELEKSGELKNEYKSEEFKEAVDVVASSRVGKIFILTPTKILEIELAK